MKRTNPSKGKGINPGFVPISWDEAMDTIATKLMELRANNETHKFALLRGRYSNALQGIIYDAFPKVFGTPNNISHSAICAEAEKFGAYYTEGQWAYRSYDLENTDCLVIWGADPLSSNRHLPYTIKMLPKILERGGKIITIDPRLSTSSLKSNIWLPIKPGQDGALASAIAHVILTDGNWHKSFVGDFIDGINKFIANMTVDEGSFAETHSLGIVKWWNLELKDKTPAWAASITGITESKIVEAARAMASAAPKTCVWLGPGACMSPRGAYAAMAIHALNGLLGSADNEGGTYYKPSITVGSLPSTSAYQDDIAKAGLTQKKIDQRGTIKFPALASGKSGGGVVSNRVAQAVIDSNPYDIKVMIGYWVNYAFSGYQSGLWHEALKKVPFYVHIGTNACEMSNFADIVLPAAHHATEKLSGSDNSGNLLSYVSIQQPVIQPLWDVKSDESEIPWLLAVKLKEKGFSKLFDYFVTEFKDPDIGTIPADEKQFTLFATMRFCKDAYDKVGGWDMFKTIGVTHYGPHSFRNSWSNMKTVSKKFEFYSETLKKALKEHADKHTTSIDDVLTQCNITAQGDTAFVPHYEPPLRIGSKAGYPLEFVDYKSRLNREGRTANLAWYHEFKKVDTGDVSWEDVLKINPDDAKSLNLKDGDMIKLSSETGSGIMKIKIWPGIVPGTVTKCYGQGHDRYGRIASKDFMKAEPRGASNNDFLPAEYDRLSGSSARNGGYFGVRIDPVTSVRSPKIIEGFDLRPIYPNPVSSSVVIASIYAASPSNIQLELFNSVGQKVGDGTTIRVDSGNHTIPINLHELSSGTYFVRMVSGDFTKSQKFIVKR